jgi:hypothetical protein
VVQERGQAKQDKERTCSYSQPLLLLLLLGDVNTPVYRSCRDKRES